MDHNLFDFTFVVMNNGKGEEEYRCIIEKNNDKVILLPSIKKTFLFVKAFKKIITTEYYDIMHVHLMNLGWIFFGLSKIFSPHTKRLLHAHSTAFSGTKWKNTRNKLFAKISIRLAQKLWACSRAAGDSMFGNRSYTIINNAIDVNQYKFSLPIRKQVREQFGCEQKVVFGTIGRMAIEKNPLFAVDVFYEMLQYSDQLEYWWVGDGQLREQVENKISQLGLQDKFKLLGKRDDAWKLYQGMDLFMLPSLFEGLPVVVVEAEASGLPIVMSDSITREISCDNCKYISLSCGAKAWAKEIYNWITTNKSEFQKRENQLRTDFDICVQAKILERKYLQLNEC